MLPAPAGRLRGTKKEKVPGEIFKVSLTRYITAKEKLFLHPILNLDLYRFKRSALRRVRISCERAPDFFESIVVASEFHINIDQSNTRTVIVVVDPEVLLLRYALYGIV